MLLWLNIIGEPKEYRSSLVCGYTKIDWHSEKNLLGGMYSLIGSSLRFVRWNFVYGSIASKNVEIRSYNFILLATKLFHNNVSYSFSFLFLSISSANFLHFLCNEKLFTWNLSLLSAWVYQTIDYLNMSY